MTAVYPDAQKSTSSWKPRVFCALREIAALGAEPFPQLVPWDTLFAEHGQTATPSLVCDLAVLIHSTAFRSLARGTVRVKRMLKSVLPSDVRGTAILKGSERGEVKAWAAYDALGDASVEERYELLWQQQMEKRKSLVEFGNASGIYKAVIVYAVGISPSLLDFVNQLNTDDGPLEALRSSYGPYVYHVLHVLGEVRQLVQWLIATRQGKEETVLTPDALEHLCKSLYEVYKAMQTYVEFIYFINVVGPFFRTDKYLEVPEEGDAAPMQLKVGARSDDYVEFVLNDLLLAKGMQEPFQLCVYATVAERDVVVRVVRDDAEDGVLLPDGQTHELARGTVEQGKPLELNDVKIAAPGRYRVVVDNTSSMLRSKDVTLSVFKR